MNKKVFKYSVRFVAFLLGVVALASCSKDKFTEQDALNIELTRLRVQDSIRNAREISANNRQDVVRNFQRIDDSLRAVNAGGIIFYSVAVVQGQTTATGSGRLEDMQGVPGATVTVSQYGRTLTAPASTAGLYTFTDLRSGLATVVVAAAGHTTANYTVSLVTAGASNTSATNGSVLSVGNVVPLFANTGLTLDNAALVRGRAYIETNLLNDRPEVVTPAMLGATGNVDNAPTTSRIANAYIDVLRSPANLIAGTSGAGGGASNGVTRTYFQTRFLDQANQDLGTQNSNSPGRPGRIVRFGYEGAVSNQAAALDANGNYAIFTAASAVGLPISLEFTEIATNRTFFRNNILPNTAQAPIVERFIYGPNTNPSTIDLGVAPVSVTFSTVTTPATATASITPGTSGILLPPAVSGRTINGSAANVNDGFYYTNPTLSIAATGGGTGAAAGVSTGTAGSAALQAGTALVRVPGATSNLGTLSATGGNSGTGYTAVPAITLTRTDTAFIGFGQQIIATAGAGFPIGQAVGTPINIIDGGTSFVYSAPGAATLVGGVSLATSVSATGAFTNAPPTILFSTTTTTGVTVASAISMPDNGPAFVGGPTTAAAVSVAQGSAGAVRYSSSSVSIAAAAGPFTAVGPGAIARVEVTGVGGGYTAAPVATPSFGSTVTIPGRSAGIPLFQSDGNGGLRFNVAYTNTAFGGTSAAVAYTLTNSLMDFRQGNTVEAGIQGQATTAQGSIAIPYTFVPSVGTSNSVNTVIPAGSTAAQFVVQVGNDPRINASFGRVVSIRITGSGSFYGTAAAGGPAAGADVTKAVVAGDFAGGALVVAGTGILHISGNAAPTAGATNGQIDLNLSPATGNSFALAPTPGNTNTTISLQGSGLNNYSIITARNTFSFLTSANVASALTGTVDNIVNGSDWLVVLGAPNNTAVPTAAQRFSWGVPTFNGTTVTGVQILDNGNGYLSGAGNRVPMYLVPNIYRGNATPAGAATTGALVVSKWIGTAGTVAATADNYPGFNGASPSTNLAKNNIMYDVVTPGIGQARIAFGGITSNAATLTISMTNAGSGYAVQPTFILNGGTADIPTSDAVGAAVTTAAGGNFTPTGGTATPIYNVLTGSFAAPFFNVAFPTAASETAFRAGGASTASVIIIDRITSQWNAAYAAQTLTGAAGVQVNSVTGRIDSVFIGDPAQYNPIIFQRPATLATALIPNATTSVRVALGAPAQTPGTQATALVTLQTGQTGTIVAGAGRLAGVVMTNRGSGYVAGNIIGRNVNGTPVLAAVAGSPGIRFSIYGGFDNGLINAGNPSQGGENGGTNVGGGFNAGGATTGPANQTNSNFDAFTGMTYIRDVYYGSGRESVR